jgi:DNA mismatch repair protein MSH6
MSQYWNYKKDNFDKILFFKLGRFYEMFYEDAIACHILLDLNWMGGKYKVHVGFPENMLLKTSQKLVNMGFEVAVVD